MTRNYAKSVAGVKPGKVPHESTFSRAFDEFAKHATAGLRA